MGYTKEDLTEMSNELAKILLADLDESNENEVEHPESQAQDVSVESPISNAQEEADISEKENSDAFGDDDFWGEPTQNQEPMEASPNNTNEAQPSSSDEDDFWNNSTPTNTSSQEQVVVNATPITQEAPTPVSEDSEEIDLEEEKRLLEALNSELENTFGGVLTQEEYNAELEKQFGDEAREKVFNNVQDFELINTEPNTCTFNGHTFTYTEFNKEYDLNSIGIDLTNSADVAVNYARLCQFITDDIISLFGGVTNINSIMVLDGEIIVNSIKYSPLIPEELIKVMPIDTQLALYDGRYAQYFDFNTIRKMRKLNELSFKDKSFIYTKVRFDLGFSRDFEAEDLFLVCKPLSYLEIGNTTYTRSSIKEAYDVNAYFKQHNNVYKLMSWLHSSYVGVKGAKSSFKMAKDIWNSDGAFHKTRAVAMGVLGTATGLLGGATWGIGKILEGSNYIGKKYGSSPVIKKAKDSVGSVFSALNEKY